MTQQDFDRLPLLLRYAQVVAVLEGLNRRTLVECIADGSLRCWPARKVPGHYRYYLKADVAAMAGLRLTVPELPRPGGWLRRGELQRLLGLGEKYFEAMTREGWLECDREPPPRRRLRLRTAFFAAPQVGSSAVDGGRKLTTDERER